MADFESFARRMAPLRDPAAVTIHRRGTLSLNRSAYVALGEPDAVHLLYDRGAGTIGLRPAGSRERDASQLRPASQRGNGPWVISAMAFVRYYGIDVTVTRRRSAELRDGVLCVDLTDPA